MSAGISAHPPLQNNGLLLTLEGNEISLQDVKMYCEATEINIQTRRWINGTEWSPKID